MNNKHILDLTLRLSQALDQNYDVVNMETVVSVISALEGTPITKEQLEATRLAKYINQLRRRTKCENLARRAKSLLKRWREMVGMQQSNETTASTSVVGYVPPSTAVTSSTTTNTPFNIPASDNAVSNSQLTNPQYSHQQFQIQQQYQSNVKQHQIQQQLPYRSEPSSPVNLQEKYNPNELLISISNPATGPQVPKSSNTNTRKKRKIEKNVSNETITQQPTSFANLITGLGTTFVSSRKSTREKADPVTSMVKPMETFVIEHSSNSNSDLICIPSNNTVSSNFTLATDVPPVVIDLQDTNSSMNSLVSKDVTNVSSSFYRNKVSTKKSKKEKKRKDRNTMLRQNQPLQDCDDQNTTTASYQNKQPSDVLLLDEKSHSACPTISNISEILSLSNSSMSSVFPSADAISKNIFQSGQNELASPSVQMSKSDLTFAGKFKQNTSSTSTGCNVLNYNSDSINTNALNNNSLNQNKFSMFGGIGNNSNDSSSSSRTSSFHDVVYTVKREASNSMQNIEFGAIKHDVNEKSLSNMSNKGNSSTENTFALGASTVAGAQNQQESIDLTKEVSSQKVIKTPKKRGRKKGSKGVDSVIAKETSLSSQMLLAPLGVAGKKVKTTKELYAEMESRKLRKAIGEQPVNSPTNWVGQQQIHQQKPVISRCPSLSDIADSDSCTMTSEHSRDSGNIVSKATKGKREVQLENNSNYSKHDSEVKAGDAKSDERRILTGESSVLEITSKIKLEIQEILKLLNPPLTVEEIEYECLNSITPCTCSIEEINGPPENETITVCGDNDSKDSRLNDTNSTNINEKDIKQLRITNDQMTNMTDNIQRADNGQKEAAPRPPPPPPVKMKKSIFDLDFDDDDDPLNSIIADIEGKNMKSDETERKAITKETVDDKFELPPKTEDVIGKVDQQNEPYALNVPTSYSESVAFPSYEIKLNPDCEAKNRFEIQTQKITKFHVDTLHNCYIPNVNGNWNHANALEFCIYNKNTDNFPEQNTIIDGYDVVPMYGSDMNEQIAKDLSHVKFSNKFKVKLSKRQDSHEVLFNIPFLGVSRIPDVDDTKLRCKDIKKLTLEEEKENVEYKSNLENILLNASALDTDDAKDRVETEADAQHIVKNPKKLKTNKNLRKTSFKRTKSHATLVKRSTIKRLKLDVNGTPETNTTNSNDSDNTDELKLHRRLFFHEELCSMDRNSISLSNQCIFHISSCSSGCSSEEGDETSETLNCRTRLNSISSSSSSESEYNVSNIQQEIIQSELTKLSNCTIDKYECDLYNSSLIKSCVAENDVLNNYDENELPKENNRMLLSFNNIYNKSTRDENADQQNKMLKQQLQNCDDYKHLNNNFNLIKYIDNKTNSVNNINNNNNSCSNNYSDKIIKISSSSSENPTNPAVDHQHNNKDNDVQIRPFKEYQTGMRAVDEDVNDDDGNNCRRLQQFKEWHEVLQLRSYNDELLTVLPYVVLE